MIIFCGRDHLNHIVGLFISAQVAGQEQIDDQSPEVLAYQAAGKVPDQTPLLDRVAALESKVTAIAAVPAVATVLAAQPVLDTPVQVTPVGP